MPAPFDILTRRRLPSEDQIDLWVHSGTGADTNSGNQGSPLASTEEALGRLPSLGWGRRAVVNYLAGHAETIARPLFFPPMVGAGHLDDVALDAAEPSWDFVRAQVQLQAAPTTLETVTGTITIADATSQLVVITDTSKAWGLNEHRGRLVLNLGNIAEYGVISSNTATQLFVTVISGGMSDGNVVIAVRDATLTLGSASPSDFIQTGMTMAAAHVTVGFVGMNFALPIGAAGPAIDLISHAGVSFLLCEISGGVQMRPGSGIVSFDGCYIHGGAFAPNGQPMALRGSFLDTVTMNYHGSGGAGQFDVFGCRIDKCGPLGHGGTSLPEGGFNIDQTWISNGTSHGVAYTGGNRARVRKTRIDTCAGDAVHVDGCGNIRLETVTGSGSTGWGCQIDNGAHVLPVTTTVSGASGEVRLGGSTTTWGAAPQVSASRLCRFGA